MKASKRTAGVGAAYREAASLVAVSGNGTGMAAKAAVFAVIAFTLSPLAAFVLSAVRGGEEGGQGAERAIILALFSPATLSALRFSLSQAALSTLLAFIAGFPGAYFVAKYEFRGRRFFLALAAIPFCLPSILVVLSFILYYGKSGWFSLALAKAGLASEGGSLLYSLWGLVFVHAFYNFPIFMQNVGSVWARMPRSREEAARTLGAGRLRSFAVGTLPYLLPSMLQAASLVFLFCFFSFTIVLVFGSLAGTTLEVGIYRAIRFTNDRPQALALAFVQTCMALLAVAAFAHFDRKTAASAKGFGDAPPRRRPGLAPTLGISAYLFCIVIFFLGPLVALGVEAFTVRSSFAGGRTFGLDNFTRLIGTSTGSDGSLVPAILNSLALSGSAAISATALGVLLAAASHYSGKRSGLGGWITALPLALSPALIASGWSALLSQGGAMLIILAQTSIAWPFVARSVSAAFTSLDRSRNEAARSLGATPIQAGLRVDVAMLAPSLASAAAFAFSITMGDANIPLILGSGRHETLPLLLYRLTSSYRFNEACAVGIILALFTSIAFFLKEKTYEAS